MAPATLLLGLLLGLSQAQITHNVNFVFFKEDATGSGNNWVWIKEKIIDFAANDKADLVYDFTSMEGSLPSGEMVTLTDEYVMKIEYEGADGLSLDSQFSVAGPYGQCTDKNDCSLTTHYECDFSKGGGTSIAQNGDVTQQVKIKVTVETGDPNNVCSWVEVISEGLAAWAKMVLIISITAVVLCVLCIVLVCCG